MDVAAYFWIFFDSVFWIFLLICAYALFWLFFLPMNRVRQLNETGWKHLDFSGLKKQNVWLAKKNRRQGEYPAPYPNGWYVLAESRELKKGQIRQVDALGKTFAVFRGESGRVFVADAYCPHLGANLCSGGKIDQDCVTCPFHAWRFSGEDGTCKKIPYSSQKPPKNSDLKIHRSLEQNGHISVWHHHKDEEPNWWPEIIPEIDSSKWVYQGRNEYYVNCHIQEIPENGADGAHLNSVHKAGIICGGEPAASKEELAQKISNHSWNVTWEPMKESHKARISLNHCMLLFDRLKLFNLNLEAIQIGPATVHMYFKSFMGRGVMIQSVLPIQPLVQKLVHVFYTERSWLPPYAKLVLLGESIHLERDIRIWNNKMYKHKPVLVKEDAYIARFRRWYSQFYPKDEEEGTEPVILPSRDLSW